MKHTCAGWIGIGLLLGSLGCAAGPRPETPSVGCAEGPPSAERVLLSGRVVTLDEHVPEGQALAMGAGEILAVGSDAEIRRWIGPETDVIDLQGALAIPGLIEGHGHFLGVGDAEMQLDLRPAKSWEEIVEMVRVAALEASPGELIRGRGWHQEKWTHTPTPSVEGLPLHDSLDRASPNHPVVLVHASGHASFANVRAMALAGISAETPDPSGGTIVRDGRGRPTGMFRETAAALLAPAYARAAPIDRARVVRLAVKECLEKGITSFQDAGSSFETLQLLHEAAERGDLGVRLWVMLRDRNERMAERLADARVIGAWDEHLTVRAIKHSIDGALGSHGAWLLAPYADLSETSGLNTTSVPVIEETARLALEHGYQLCVHAIGDRANRETLDLFERAFLSRPELEDLRWRVEHAQHLARADIPRFAQLGVVASMQAVHCTSDAPFVPPRLGEDRAREGAYVWRDLWDSGAVVTNGTDAPVEDVDPIATFHAVVTCEGPDGSVFYPHQCLTRTEALRAATLNNAWAAFEEDRKGSLTPGKLADVTVLSKDILTCPPEEILAARVLYTIVGGEVMYRRP